MKRFGLYSIVWVTVLSLLFSCRTIRDGQYYQDIHPDDVEVGFIEDSRLNIEIAYIGAIGHSFIFECTIENNTNEMMVIDRAHFALEYNGQITYTQNEDQIINDLHRENKRLKKRKKDATLISGIIVGLGVIAGASNGLNAGEVLVYNADPIIAIFDERRWYQRNIESVEDEVDYIREAQFKQQLIPPGKAITRDLLFPTTRMTSDVTVIFTYIDQEYTVTFPKKIFR